MTLSVKPWRGGCSNPNPTSSRTTTSCAPGAKVGTGSAAIRRATSCARCVEGEQAIFYHSNAKPPGVAGICKIVKTAEPDPTQFDPNSKYYDAASKPEDPRWDWVTVAPVRALPFVSLDELRALPELADCRLLAKGNRLSVVPLRDAEFDTIVDFATRRRH